MSQTDASFTMLSGAVPEKNERSYSLQGLPDRDALVFKSMVRLLSHRTKYTWVYSPSSTELLVMAEGKPPPAGQPMVSQQLLTLGTASLKRPSYLQIPLHANDLEIELNRLGALIVPTSQSAREIEVEHSKMTAMRMTRWPPATVLTSSARVRMATLMVGKSLTIVELQQRSKEKLVVGMAFFDDLKKIHLLTPVVAAPTAIVPVQPVASTDPMLARKSPVQSGLLGRIRVRLGLPITQASERVGKP